MKFLVYIGAIAAICLVIGLAEADSDYDSDEEINEEYRDKRQASAVRVPCRNGGFTCKSTGQRGISCSTVAGCRDCKITKVGGGALDLYCNEGSNRNAHFRCSTKNGRVSCIG